MVSGHEYAKHQFTSVLFLYHSHDTTCQDQPWPMAVRRELITTAIPNEGEIFGDQIIPTTRIVWLLFFTCKGTALDVYIRGELFELVFYL